MPPASQTFDQLHDEYRPIAIKIAIRFLKNEEDAEDVVQAVMLSLYQQIQTGVTIRNPRQWFATAIKNAALNFLSRAGLDEISLDSLKDDNGDVEPAENPYDEPSFDPRLKQALAKAVDQLPASVSECMTRFYYAGESVAQIALGMKLSPSTVTGNMTRGRNMLREMFTRGEKKVA